MPNPQLTSGQRKRADELLNRIRQDLIELAGDDPALLFAYRRRIAKLLNYDERGPPTDRGKIKKAKRIEQDGLCPECHKPLPATYCVLDRTSAIGGYTIDNTRLLCEPCDRAIQIQRRYQ